jgi:hypothetical protein
MLAYGLWLIFDTLFRGERRAYLALGAVVVLGLALFFLFVAPMVHQEGGEEEEAGWALNVLQFIDPLIEIVGTCIAVAAALVLMRKPGATPWILLALGLILHTTAAMMYDLVIEGVTHATSHAHLLSFWGYACIAVAAYLKTDHGVVQKPAKARQTRAA